MKFRRISDPWIELRQDLYGNVEPEIKLENVTYPNNKWGIIDWKKVEMLPAIAAGVSYGSKQKLEDDYERACGLNKKLIDQGHLSPLEVIQIGFHISGISKACGAQMSRHRVGQGHVSASRRFQKAEPKFVYPVLEYVTDESKAFRILTTLGAQNKESIIYYNRLRDKYGCHKEDARMVLPVSYTTERSWFINVRALRDFLRLRLAPDAEWEIRRLSIMLLDIVKPKLPSLFFDFEEEESC